MLLTAAEEVELARKIASGDKSARDRLFLSNTRLVVSIAKDFKGRGVDLEELSQEGMIGLLKACDEFDPDRGTRFTTYAAYWIKQSIKDMFVNRVSLVRTPAYMVQLRIEYFKVRRKLFMQNGELPTFNRVVAELGLDKDRERGEGITSSLLSKSLRGHVSMSDVDIDIGHEDCSIDDEDIEFLEGGLKILDDREMSIIKMRFGIGHPEPMTLKQVGESIGHTREWIRRIELRAIEKIRNEMGVECTTQKKRRVVFNGRRSKGEVYA